MFLKGNWIVKNRLMIGPWPSIPEENIPNLHPIGVVVNLTGTDYFSKELEQKTVDLLNIPVKDYSVPDASQSLELIRNLSFYDYCEVPVYVHCMGGLGRAGTIAGLFLLLKGFSAEDAIKEVRRCRPGSIETREQEEYLYYCKDWMPALSNKNDQIFFNAKKLIKILRVKCPWDRKQTHETLISSLLDESFEVIDAIKEKNSDHLKEELGDLLIQPLIQAQIAENDGEFSIYDSVLYMINKLVFRHPHVFRIGNELSSDQVINQWTNLKQIETKKSEEEKDFSVDLKPVVRISNEASEYGYEWEKSDDIIEKMIEECLEIKEAANTGNKREVEQELGDLLFASLNFARFFGVDPIKSIDRGRRKFEIRFRYIQR
ncbi:MAG: MazG family protein, partial [Caldisericia bacterium]|nr:MazG family protein [Caldisericia bacterium]